MKAAKLALHFSLATALFVTSDAIAQTPQNSPLSFADVVHHYQMFQTWNATVQQQFLVKAYNQTKTASGTIRHERPDSIDVNLGGTPWSTTCAAGSPGLMFLCGPPAVAGFTFQTVDGSTMNFPDGVVFIAKPTSPNPQLVMIFFYVDPTTKEVRREMTIDAQGNRNRYDFLNAKWTYWH